jgi:hypothetical protein
MEKKAKNLIGAVDSIEDDLGLSREFLKGTDLSMNSNYSRP